MSALELQNTPLIADANLVSYWRFEGNSNDSKGSNNGTDTSITYSAGKFGNAAGFNASTDVITVPVTGWPTGAGARTMHFWVTAGPLQEGVPQAVMYYGAFSALNMFGVTFFLTSGVPKIKTDCFGGGGNSATVSDPTSGFHMVDAVYDGANVITYYDGIKVDSNAATLNTTGAAGAFGQDPGNHHQFISSGSGQIDDAAIFSRALTSSEISNLFSGSFGTQPSMGFIDVPIFY